LFGDEFAGEVTDLTATVDPIKLAEKLSNSDREVEQIVLDLLKSQGFRPEFRGEKKVGSLSPS
jgi:hypothetical protein